MKLKQLNINMKPLIKKLEVGLKRGHTQSLLSASWLSKFKGMGLEFESFRDYSETDDAKRIDWKASLRSKGLLVKEYSEERNLKVFIMLDVSDSMIFSSVDKLKCEYAAEIAGTLTAGTLAVDDSVGLCMFSDKINHFIPTKIGRTQMYRIVKAISNKENYGGNFDLNKVMKRMINIMDKGSVVFIISDFIGLKPGWVRLLEVMSAKYEVVGIMIRDPRDNRLPDNSGQFVLADPFSDTELLVDINLIKYSYEDYAEKQINEVKSIFKRFGNDFIMLETTEKFVYPLLKLIKKRVSR